MKVNGVLINKLSDVDLVKTCVKAGTEELKKASFTVLVERHYKPLLKQIKHMMYDDSEAEDVLQNTFIKAYENLHHFVGDSSVNTWLYAIARNEVINLHREKERRPPNDDVSIDELLETDVPSDFKEQITEAFTDYNTPEAIYEGTEILERISEAVAQLEERLQTLYQLRYVEQMEYHEIAEHLQWPIGTVKNRLHELNTTINKLLNERE